MEVKKIRFRIKCMNLAVIRIALVEIALVLCKWMDEQCIQVAMIILYEKWRRRRRRWQQQ